MVTGYKRRGLSHTVANRRPAVRGTLLACVILAAVMIGGGLALSLRPRTGVPVLAANQPWAKECGACHIAFHPSLLPEASWRKIMENLADHFGEDASLDAKTTVDITGFLTANAAERWDTLPANRLRAINEEKPLQITATRFWVRTHRDIPPPAFAMKLVGAKQNCAACHADAATGMFAPQNINIPEETLK
jgi:cytochrome c553